MKKIFMAIMNEMAFLFDNDVQYMNVDFPSENNPYCQITLMVNEHHNKTILLENYLHEQNKHYTKTVDYNKWLEYYSYSFMYNDIHLVYTIKGYKDTI